MKRAYAREYFKLKKQKKQKIAKFKNNSKEFYMKILEEIRVFSKKYFGIELKKKILKIKDNLFILANQIIIQKFI